jgi:hypothetical protein
MKRLIDSIERVKSSWSADRWDPRIRGRVSAEWTVVGKKVLLVYLFGGLGCAALLAPNAMWGSRLVVHHLESMLKSIDRRPIDRN